MSLFSCLAQSSQPNCDKKRGLSLIVRAQRAAQAILQQFTRLETTPAIGRPLPDAPELRELLVPFGDAGYVALYRHSPGDDAIYILAFRHQKEAGF